MRAIGKWMLFFSVATASHASTVPEIVQNFNNALEQAKAVPVELGKGMDTLIQDDAAIAGLKQEIATLQAEAKQLQNQANQAQNQANQPPPPMDGGGGGGDMGGKGQEQTPMEPPGTVGAMPLTLPGMPEVRPTPVVNMDNYPQPMEVAPGDPTEFTGSDPYNPGMQMPSGTEPMSAKSYSPAQMASGNFPKTLLGAVQKNGPSGGGASGNTPSSGGNGYGGGYGNGMGNQNSNSAGMGGGGDVMKGVGETAQTAEERRTIGKQAEFVTSSGAEGGPDMPTVATSEAVSTESGDDVAATVRKQRAPGSDPTAAASTPAEDEMKMGGALFALQREKTDSLFRGNAPLLALGKDPAKDAQAVAAASDEAARGVASMERTPEVSALPEVGPVEGSVGGSGPATSLLDMVRPR